MLRGKAGGEVGGGGRSSDGWAIRGGRPGSVIARQRGQKVKGCSLTVRLSREPVNPGEAAEGYVQAAVGLQLLLLVRWAAVGRPRWRTAALAVSGGLFMVPWQARHGWPCTAEPPAHPSDRVLCDWLSPGHLLE